MEEGGKQMRKADKADTFLVSKDFLVALEEGKFSALVEQYNLCDWGSDVSECSSAG